MPFLASIKTTKSAELHDEMTSTHNNKNCSAQASSLKSKTQTQLWKKSKCKNVIFSMLPFEKSLICYVVIDWHKISLIIFDLSTLPLPYPHFCFCFFNRFVIYFFLKILFSHLTERESECVHKPGVGGSRLPA